MTREEAIAIIRKEYLCVDRDCDIDRSCGKCDLMIPSKEPILEAYKVAIKALEEPSYNSVKSELDAISRQAVIDEIEFFQINPQHFDFVSLIDNIKDLPSVKPQEPKTGKWIKYGIPRCGEQHYKCTSCEYYINFGQWGELYTKEFKYCPHCGAKMVQESEVQE